MLGGFINAVIGFRLVHFRPRSHGLLLKKYTDQNYGAMKTFFNICQYDVKKGLPKNNTKKTICLPAQIFINSYELL